MILDISFVCSFAKFVYLWLACEPYSGQSESGRLLLGLYDLNWSIIKSVSGASLLSESLFVFQS